MKRPRDGRRGAGTSNRGIREDSIGVGGTQNSGSSSWEYPTNVSKAPAGAVQAGEKVTQHEWPCLEGLWIGPAEKTPTVSL